jgi:hypothetical protein
MNRLSRLALSGLLSFLLVGAALGQTAKPLAEPVSYAELGKLVRSYKGKVVLVYVWAHY